ncbi:MAG: aminopeptidase P family protein [Acidobacteria bacterium]|nr:aminopeptidase P family protein [Acidobacteriota bacterium]MCA1639515.1 aminopeptidase P family protein [Acidobacteriota bacterium]
MSKLTKHKQRQIQYQILLTFLIVCLLNLTLSGQPQVKTIGARTETLSIPLREQAKIQQQWLKQRVERVLPQLMRKHKVKMWLVICREYNEDPVFFSLVSPTTFAARRRTIYVFNDRGEKEGIERLALGGGSNGGLYTVYRDPETENRELYGEGQWALLKKLITERNPENIAVNISSTHAFSDGLSAGEREKLEAVLGAEYTRRIIRAEDLPLEYVETRLPEMMPTYRSMMEVVHSLISRAFSNEVIKVGTTTNEDVVWWLRQQLSNNRLGTWFQPSVRVQRKEKAGVNILAENTPTIIQRGDVLHVDFGITLMRLNTDTQHMGYVLREGEKDVPAGIKRALANSNRLQDIVMERMKVGRTGNEVLTDALLAMKVAGINGSVYTHPIGDHGHGAGPLIGLWDRQQGVPGRGDVKLISNSWFAIELATTTPVPEWNNQELWVGQEENAAIDEQGRIKWVLKRQREFHLVK